ANLAAIVGEEKLAKNVNGDEAAVMGAVFRAASLSRQFKVKEVRLKDISPFPIEVKYTGEAKDASTPGKPFLTSIFNERSVLGTRKIMSFKRITDFGFDLQYGEVSAAHGAELSNQEIAHVSLTGLTEAINKFKDVSVATPKVKVTIELSESGILSVQEAIATIETDSSKKASLADKVKSFFGGSEKNEDVKEAEPRETDEEQGTAEAAKEQEKVAEEAKENKTAEAATNNTETSAKNETVPTTQTEKIVLKIQTDYKGIVPLTTIGKKDSLAKIQRLDALDAAKRAQEEARNSLESFLYRGRELLYRDEIMEVSTKEERENLSENLSTISDWLEENEDAETAEFQTRLKDLRKIERPLSIRAAERVSRPKAFASLRSSVTMARAVGEQLLTGEGAFHDSADVQKLYDACDEVLAWITEMEAAQAELPLWKDGVVSTREIQLRGNPVEREMHRLMSKKKPKVVKKEKEANATETKEEEKEKEETEKAGPKGDKETTEEEQQQGKAGEAAGEEEAEPAKHKKDEL
ncbi:lumenal Hsp70 protein, partial [Mortierella sp. 14UC]